MKKTVIIGLAEMSVEKAPNRITTLGLGSCVGVTLYDRVSKIGGMVHIVLPEGGNTPGAVPAKYADTAVNALLNEMLRAGANRSTIVAKMAGGAHMFGKIGVGDGLKVGDRNAYKSKLAILKLHIPIVAEDLGGTYGRTIELDTEDGSLLIKTVGKGSKVV